MDFDGKLGRRRAGGASLGPTSRTVAPILRQAPDVGAGDARMGDIADDGDGQAVKRAFGLAERQQIEQALRRVFVHTVTRVDDGDCSTHSAA